MVCWNGHSANSHQYADPLSHTDHYTYSSASGDANVDCHTHTSSNAGCHVFA